MSTHSPSSSSASSLSSLASYLFLHQAPTLLWWSSHAVGSISRSRQVLLVCDWLEFRARIPIWFSFIWIWSSSCLGKYFHTNYRQALGNFPNLEWNGLIGLLTWITCQGNRNVQWDDDDKAGWFCQNKQHIKNSHRRVRWRYHKHGLNHCLLDAV